LKSIGCAQSAVGHLAHSVDTLPRHEVELPAWRTAHTPAFVANEEVAGGARIAHFGPLKVADFAIFDLAGGIDAPLVGLVVPESLSADCTRVCVQVHAFIAALDSAVVGLANDGAAAVSRVDFVTFETLTTDCRVVVADFTVGDPALAKLAEASHTVDLEVGQAFVAQVGSVRRTGSTVSILAHFALAMTHRTFEEPRIARVTDCRSMRFTECALIDLTLGVDALGRFFPSQLIFDHRFVETALTLLALVGASLAA